MKVIKIEEENHGFIGVATSKKAAWQFIVTHGWLGFWDQVYIFDSWVTIYDLFEENDWKKTEEELIYWALHRNEELWDGMFYFSEIELHGEM